MHKVLVFGMFWICFRLSQTASGKTTGTGKTGLGSSAALVVSLVSAIFLHCLPQPVAQRIAAHWETGSPDDDRETVALANRMREIIHLVSQAQIANVLCYYYSVVVVIGVCERVAYLFVCSFVCYFCLFY